MDTKTQKGHQLAGQMAVLAGALLWSTSALFIKMLELHPVVIAGSRSFLAAIFLLVVRFISPPPKSAKNKAFPFWASAICFALMIHTFVYANTITTAANAILLQYSAPIWAALLGWWLVKEKPHWEHWGALFFVMAGLLLFFGGGLDSGAILGNYISIVSGVLLGAYTVFLRMLKDGNPRDAMLAAHIICAALSIPFVILHPPPLVASTVLPLLYMGFMQMGLSSLLFSYGIKRIPAIQAMLTSIVDPMFSPVWVFLILGEVPAIAALVGGFIIISAVIASSIIGLRRAERQ